MRTITLTEAEYLHLLAFFREILDGNSWIGSEFRRSMNEQQVSDLRRVRQRLAQAERDDKQ